MIFFISTPAPTVQTEPWAVHILGQPLNPIARITSTSTWQNAWTAHVILFSLFFSSLSVYSVYGIVRSHDRKDKVTRVLGYVIHTLIALLGLTRLFTLSVLYNQVVATSVRGRISIVSRIVYGLGFPCITAAFGLVQFSFTEALKGKLSESKLGSFAFIGFVVSGHFLIVLTVEILTTLLNNLIVLFFATKTYFLFMTAIIMVRIVYSGYMVLSHASENRRALRSFSHHYGATITSAEPHRRTSVAEKDMARSLRKVRKIIISTTIFCSVICIMEIYSICDLAGIVAGNDGALAPWPWYTYQTFFRLAELGMAGTILYTLAPPTHVKDSAEKRRLLWKRIFGAGKTTQTAQNQVMPREDDGQPRPMAVLNRAYCLDDE